jgi:lipopolysaccharide export system protein LptA
MRFSADQLSWNHASGTLILNGNVSIQEAALGTINAAKQLELQYKNVKGKQLLKRLQAQGETLLTYSDPAFSRPHKLLSHGKMEIDRDKLLASLESPEGASDKQLYYEEEEMGIFADRALLEYAETGDFLKPISLQLKGNIRLFSHDPKQPPRCGIADRLHYSLATRTLILLANPGSNVLFWDEAQGLRMSASEIHITYEEGSKERMVKGVGKVQLTLTSEEQHRLKQLFPHYKVAL